MTTPRHRVACEAALNRLGYRRSGRGAWHRGREIALRVERHWLTAVRPAAAPVDLLTGHRGRPGLWKLVPHGNGARWELHLPLDAITHAGESEAWDYDGENDLAEALESCLGWIEAAARDDLPAGWQPPARATVESWLDGGWTVAAPPRVLQAELACEPDRLALRIPLAAHRSMEMSSARGAWLREVLLDAQQRTRLARLAMDRGAGAKTVVAETDLSGVPSAAAERVFGACLESLRRTSAWLARSVGFLADARVACRLWETGPARPRAAERS